MSHSIYRSKEEPEREGLSWKERWKGPDLGLITSWEVGRKRRETDPDLARRAERNELPVLGWKGGVDQPLKSGEKYGTLCYMAMWQGLRGEDLDIDMSEERELVCARTGVKVVYTADASKYASA